MRIPDDDKRAAEAAVWGVLKQHVGPDEIISSGVIAQIAGITRKRRVREIIEAMVNEGRCPLPVIGVAGAGYYVSDDPQRVERYANNLLHLGRKIFKRRDGVLATAKRCGVLPGGVERQTEMAL